MMFHFGGVPRLVQRLTFSVPCQQWEVHAFDGRTFIVNKELLPNYLGGNTYNTWVPDAAIVSTAWLFFESNRRMWWMSPKGKPRYVRKDGEWTLKP